MPYQLYGNLVWEGLSTDPFPTAEQGAQDGMFCKVLDTGDAYTRISGQWVYINLGLSFIKATKSGRIITDANGFYHVSFNTPLNNNIYTVELTCQELGDITHSEAVYSNIQTNGFDINTRIVSSLQVYLFSGIASDISPYKEMVKITNFSPSGIVTKTTNISTTPTLMETFICSIGYPNTQILPVGLFSCQYQTKKAAGSNNYYTYFELWKRTASGVETLISTSANSSPSALNTLYTPFVAAFITSNMSLNLTDRLVVKIYGVMLSSTANVNLYYDGNTTSRFEITPITNTIGNVEVSYVATRDYNP